MYTVALGLVFLLLTARAQNCTTDGYKNYYFSWCLNDALCQGNLRLFADDFWSFSNLLDDELLPQMDMSGADMCESGEFFWKAYLRSVDICRPNFYRDSANQCVLRAGKVSDPSAQHDVDFQGLLSPVMLVGLLLIFCWLAVKELQNWKAAREEARSRGLVKKT